ncbi:hypothetical protein PAECIP111802_03389 [Paenibacillus allorhizosphaerae]|uniref:Uncharacterized protein n=1 Tax=Paenibacillus allorhizosphaerae TaxID=2849866 RepID=A0ABM8VJ24_9BACL|nr:hypothetical protein PAECIP111802_03389 [Paenibacillus allorhizosphaerae]
MNTNGIPLEGERVKLIPQQMNHVDDMFFSG